MHVSSWPYDSLTLTLLLQRLHALHPHEPTQTHILHLASDGEILVRTALILVYNLFSPYFVYLAPHR